MKDFRALLSLPASLLGLLLATKVGAQELAWTGEPRGVLRVGADQRRDLEIQQRLQWQAPSGVRKMSDDEGEKFYLHYWDLGDEVAQMNASSTVLFGLAPIAPHSNHASSPRGLFGRSIFTRDFECPADTASCAAAGSTDLCCPTGQDCVSVSGSICCCPPGQTCTDGCAACDTANGYTSCPNSPNGGCCVPGAVCEGTGCVFYGTATTVVTLPTSTVTQGIGGTVSSSTEAQTTQVPPVPVGTTETSVLTSGYTTTVTVTESGTGGMTTIIQPTTVVIAPAPTPIPPPSDTSVSAAATQTTPVSSTCNAGLTACPASVGGGCCPSGQICATNSLCLDPSTSSTAVAGGAGGAPVRPTSVSTSDTSISAATAAPSSSSLPANCPTGFYMCSAYYMGGCCRVGRNCDSTSCPTSDSTAVESSGATVVMPVTSTTVVSGAAAVSGTQGSCANGWFSCPADASGGCCPNGHACGPVSCTATASGQQNTGKEAPSSAGSVGFAWGIFMLAVGSGIGMVWL